MTIRLLILSLAVMSTAFGGLVTIVNPSFELPAQVDGDSVGSAAGWIASTNAGVWNPPASEYASVPDGVQVGYVNTGTLSQDLGVLSVIGGVYVLDGWIGNRTDVSHDATGMIELLFGATPVITLSTNPPDGTFVNLSNTFVATSAEAISIRLSTGGIQSNFDAISLDLNPIPEPGTYVLVGLGLAALGFWRRRKTV